MNIDYDKRIDCAAITQPDGRVWTGKRHHHCIATIIQATGVKPVTGQQGFVTTSGRFVSREEARDIAIAAGQVTTTLHRTQLFSEDLY